MSDLRSRPGVATGGRGATLGLFEYARPAHVVDCDLPELGSSSRAVREKLRTMS